MSNNTDTVTVTIKNDFDFSLSDIITSGDGSDYYVSPPSDCDIDLGYLGDSLTITPNDQLTIPASMTIGNVKLDEGDLKKLKALIDLLEGLDDDNELKQMFNTQKSLNEIGK